jgi:hypothetical protein
MPLSLGLAWVVLTMLVIDGGGLFPWTAASEGGRTLLRIPALGP